MDGARRGGGPGGSGLAAKLAMERSQKELISNHKTGLPDRLLRMFAPRPGLPYMKPIVRKGPKQKMSGLAGYVDNFASPGDPEYEPALKMELPEQRVCMNKELATQARVEAETKPEKVLRKHRQALERNTLKVDEALKMYDPQNDPNAEGDAFKTLFVSRLSYETTERKLKREFEEYGPVKRVRMVTDLQGKPRGYAFVEFEHRNDMKTAYKNADGRKIDERRVLVDVERGRTVPGWRPKRLNGGLGGESRAPKEPKSMAKKLLKKIIDEYLQGIGQVGGVERERGMNEEDRARAAARVERDRQDREAAARGGRDGRDRGYDRDRGGRGFERERGGYDGGARYDASRGYDARGPPSFRGEDRRHIDRDRGERDRGERDSYRHGDRDRDRKRDRDDRGDDRSASKRHRDEGREDGRANGYSRRERDA